MSKKLEIKSIHLYKFRALYLSNIKDFKYTVDQMIQIILGTNGSGKSSLLRMLTPCIPDKNEFDKGGFKEITIESDKGTFVLRNDYKSGQHHSFKLNGEELNDGGTTTVFKDLVLKEFGYDDNLHRLLTGSVSFTKMAPMTRKELIYKVSNIDVEYALKVFDKAKSNYRDIVGVLKHLEFKVQDITQRVVDDVELEELAKRLTELQDKATEILPKTNRTSMSNAEADNEFQLANRRLQYAIENSRRVFNDRLTGFKFVGVDHANSVRDDLTSELKITESKRKEVGGLLHDMNSIKHKLDAIPDNVTVSDLDKEITVLEERLAKVDSLNIPLTLSIKDTRNKINEAYVKFMTVIEVSLTDVVVLTAEEATAIKNRFNELVTLKNETSLSVKRIEDILHHAELASVGDVVCGNCDFVNLSKASLSNIEKAGYNTKLSEARIELDASEKLILELEPDLLKVKALSEAMKDLRKFVQTHGAVKDIITRRNISDVLSKPNETLMAIHRHLEDYNLVINSIADRKRLEDLLKMKDALLVSSIGYDEKSAKNYEDKFEDLVACEQELTKRLKYVNVAINAHVAKLEQYTIIKSAYDDAKEKLSASIKSSTDNGYNRLMDETLNTIAAVKSKLDTATSVKRNLEELISERDKLALRKGAYEHLLLALSPKKGIIADAIRTVIEDFTNDVNKTISRMWEYRLDVMPYTKATDLTYKMPLVTDNNVVGDISMGSKGQQDVINLAITINIMVYRGITNYPLFLDEIGGSSFDSVHRDNFFRFVRELVSSGECSQVFMVNHFTSEYGGVSNSDTVVLCPGNIVVPSEYNTNVEIK